jgi:hypothetical protein
MTGGGSMCSKSGRRYELVVQKACSTVLSPILKIPLNTQSASDLGGCDYTRPDLLLNWAAESDVVVEIKRNHAPDWIQTALTVGEDGAWCPKVSKRNHEVAHIVRGILDASCGVLYPEAPPFLSGDMTIHEWDGVWHMFGNGMSYRPWAIDNSELRAGTAESNGRHDSTRRDRPAG